MKPLLSNFILSTSNRREWCYILLWNIIFISWRISLHLLLPLLYPLLKRLQLPTHLHSLLDFISLSSPLTRFLARRFSIKALPIKRRDNYNTLAMSLIWLSGAVVTMNVTWAIEFSDMAFWHPSQITQQIPPRWSETPIGNKGPCVKKCARSSPTDIKYTGRWGNENWHSEMGIVGKDPERIFAPTMLFSCTLLTENYKEHKPNILVHTFMNYALENY